MADDEGLDTEIAQLNERLTSLERGFAVQTEVAAVERSGYATREDLARIEAALANCATKVDIARIDAVLDSIQKNYATKGDVLQLEARLAQMEARITRWMLATLMTVAGLSGGAVFAVVKLLQ